MLLSHVCQPPVHSLTPLALTAQGVATVAKHLGPQTVKRAAYLNVNGDTRWCLLKDGRVYIAASTGIHPGYHIELAPADFPADSMLLDANMKYVTINSNVGTAANFSFDLFISGTVDGVEKTYTYSVTHDAEGRSTDADVKGWFQDLSSVSLALRNWERTGKGMIAAPVAAAGAGGVGVGAVGIGACALSAVAGTALAPAVVAAVVGGVVLTAGSRAMSFGSNLVASVGKDGLSDPNTVAKDGTD